MTHRLFNKKVLGGAASLMAVLIFFMVTAFVAHQYTDQLQGIVNKGGVLGMIAYVLITALAVVIAPISTLPLIPLAVSIWGWITAAILSIIGWVIGSQIAFFLARTYGRSLIEKIVSLKTLQKIERYLPQENLFWTVVLLRMVVPADVLSYALGLFSRMSSTSYFAATLLGVTPFAFVFAYAGSLPLRFQISIALVILLLIVLIYLSRAKATHDDPSDTKE